MAEKAVLLDKLPPSQAETQGAAPTAPIAFTEQPVQTEVTASGFEKLTYYTFILDMLVFAFAGIFLLTKAHKNRATVNYKAMVGFGGFLLALAIGYAFLKGSYATALWSPDILPSLAPRAIIWTILAPALLYLLSQLVKIEAQQRILYLGLLAIAGALFLFIGISHVSSLPRSLAFIIGLLPLISSIAIAALLYYTLTSLPEDTPEPVRRSFTIVSFALAGGWILYPSLNLLSHLTQAPTFCLFLLNFVDLFVIAGITYAIFQSLSDASTEPVLIRTNLPVKAFESSEEQLDAGEIDDEDTSTAPRSSNGKPASPAKPPAPGKAKPKFRPPVGPSSSR